MQHSLLDPGVSIKDHFAQITSKAGIATIWQPTAVPGLAELIQTDEIVERQIGHGRTYIIHVYFFLMDRRVVM